MRFGFAVALMLAVTALPGVGDDVPRAKGQGGSLPIGEWTTFANGNDVLATAREGDVLWAGTRAGGLVRWDIPTGAHRQFLKPQDPLGDNTVHDIAIDAAGRKWLATDNGLTRFDDAGTPETADDSWYTYTVENTAGGLPSDEVHALAVRDGIVWVGGVQVKDNETGAWHRGGLGRLDTMGSTTPDDDRWSAIATFESTFHSAPDGSESVGLTSNNINDLALTEEGNLWIATGPHWSLEPTADPDLPPAWSRIHGGLSHLDLKATADTADDVFTGNSCENAQVTVTCNVQAVAVDDDGTAWAAIQGRGMLCFNGDTPNIPDNIESRFDMPDQRPLGDVVEVIAFGPPGHPTLGNTVWAGRSVGGVSVLDHRGTPCFNRDDIWNFDRGASFTTADGLPHNRVQALEVAADATFIGGGPELGIGGGISRLDIGNLTVAAPWLTDRAPASNFITAIDFGDAGGIWEDHVWIATGSRVQPRFGAGAIDLDTSGTPELGDDTWTRHTTLSTDADGQFPWSGLLGDNLHAIRVQGDRVWFGSIETMWSTARKSYDDGGLSVFDGNAWTARNVLNTGGESAGLQDGSVAVIVEGCDDSVWVGTGNRSDARGAGVAKLTPGDSIHQLTQDTWEIHRYSKLASDYTTDIDIDCARGEVWVASLYHTTLPDEMGTPGGRLLGGGLARYDIAAEQWAKWDTRDGIESYKRDTVRAVALSVLATGDGDAWLGTYGDREMTQTQLVSKRPFWPAVLNRGVDQTWKHQVFEMGGMVSSLARDVEGRVWVGTTRGGMARDSATPEGWRQDRDMTGIHVLPNADVDEAPIALDSKTTGAIANDISSIAVAPDGAVWIGTEGWGLMRYRPDGEAPTPTPVVRPPDTPTPGPSRVPPTPDLTATAGASTPGSPTPTGTPTDGREATPTTGVEPGQIYLPILLQRG